MSKMKELFMYPEDRAELFGETNEEEAHFYFTIAEFALLLERYGANAVLSRMRGDTFMLLAEWFIDKEQKKDVGVLLGSSKCM